MTTPAHPDPIRIPFATKRVLVSGDVYRTDTCGIDITPDIARQIVAIAGIPALEGERINGMDRRIAALEAKTRPTPAALHAMAEACVQQACDDLGIRKPIKNRRDGQAPASGDDPERGSGLSSAEWQSIRDNGLWLAPVIDKAHLAPASGGDEAAAICTKLDTHGITLDEARKLAAEIAALRAERDDLAKRLAEAEAAISEPMSAVIGTRSLMQKERDRALANLAACRSALREIATTVGGTVGEKCSNEFHCLVRGEVQIVVDRLKHDLAAERAAREKAERERDSWKIQAEANNRESGMREQGWIDAESERDAVQAKLAKAVGMLRVAREWGDYSGPHHYVDCHTETKNGSDCPVCKRRDEIDALLVEIGGGT